MFDRLEHFDKELARYGIVEMNEGCTAIEQQAERVKLYASLVGAERWPYSKEPVVLEHDAKCRLLVERLRGAGKLRLSNARYWFLTYDAKLPRFAKRVPDNGDEPPELPFCISPSAWVQITRALMPRTEDFERTIVDLLTSPFVGYRRAVNPSVVQEVIGRMDHLEDVSPEMALAVLTDTAAVSQIEDAVSAKDEAAIDERVRVAYSTKAREMQEAVVASERRLAEVQQELARAEAQATEAEVKRAQDEEAAKQAETGERQALEDRIASVTSDRDSAADRADAADRRIAALEGRLETEERRRQRRGRVAGGGALIVLGAAVALLLSIVVFSSAGAIGGAIIGGSAFILLGVRVVVGSRWGGEILSWGTLLVGIAAIVVAIVLAR